VLVSLLEGRILSEKPNIAVFYDVIVMKDAYCNFKWSCNSNKLMI